MKKLLSVALTTVLSVSIMAGSAFAASPAGEPGNKIKSVKIPSSISKGADLELSVFNDDGVKVYTVKGAETVEQKKKAFEILNNYMESGSVEEAQVGVTSYNTEFSGSEFGYSSVSNDAMGYTWARFVAGNVRASSSNYDKTWGGQSAGWFGTGTPTYVKLYQKVTLNVVNSQVQLTISWPPGVSVSSSRSASTATWNSDQITGINPAGAEHGMATYTWEDIGQGNVTSAVYADSADVQANGYIYRPAQGVRFNNNL